MKILARSHIPDAPQSRRLLAPSQAKIEQVPLPIRRILSELAFLLPHRLFEPFAEPFRIRRVKAQRRRKDPRLVAPLLVLRAERIIAQLSYSLNWHNQRGEILAQSFGP